MGRYAALARARASAASGNAGAIVVVIIFVSAAIRRAMQPRWERCYVDQGGAFTLVFGQLRAEPDAPPYGPRPGLLDTAPGPDIARILDAVGEVADYAALHTRAQATAAAAAIRNGLAVTGGAAAPAAHAGAASPRPALPGPSNPAPATGTPPPQTLPPGQDLSRVDRNDSVAVKRAVDAEQNRRRLAKLREEEDARARAAQVAAAERDRYRRAVDAGEECPHPMRYATRAAYSADTQRYLREQQRRAEAAAAAEKEVRDAAVRAAAAARERRDATARAAAAARARRAAAIADGEARYLEIMAARRQHDAAIRAQWPWHRRWRYRLRVALVQHCLDQCSWGYARIGLGLWLYPCRGRRRIGIR